MCASICADNAKNLSSVLSLALLPVKFFLSDRSHPPSVTIILYVFDAVAVKSVNEYLVGSKYCVHLLFTSLIASLNSWLVMVRFVLKVYRMYSLYFQGPSCCMIYFSVSTNHTMYSFTLFPKSCRVLDSISSLNAHAPAFVDGLTSVQMCSHSSTPSYSFSRSKMNSCPRSSD